MSTALHLQHKTEWNSHRSKEYADIYTIGYSCYRMPDFLTLLKDVRVLTLMDIRHDAVSMHRPEFSKSNLKQHLTDNGIIYIHRRNLGVPRNIRTETNRSLIWEWYDRYVVATLTVEEVGISSSVNRPIALMCVEADPTSCHRHRLAIALERLGLRT